VNFSKYFVLLKDFEIILNFFLFKVLVLIQILTKSQFQSLVLVLVTLAKDDMFKSEEPKHVGFDIPNQGTCQHWSKQKKCVPPN
jgi:hypothetical protein